LGNFYPNLVFLAITFEPETLESQRSERLMDFDLVSSKNLSETLPSCGWGPGHNNLGQKDVGNLPPTYDITHKKMKPKSKKKFSLQTKRHAVF